MQMVQLSATRRSCIATMRISLVSFSTITLCAASQRVFIVVSIYFVIDSVRKLLDTPSCVCARARLCVRILPYTKNAEKQCCVSSSLFTPELQFTPSFCMMSV
jgi:hypothetical protein